MKKKMITIDSLGRKKLHNEENDDFKFNNLEVKKSNIYNKIKSHVINRADFNNAVENGFFIFDLIDESGSSVEINISESKLKIYINGVNYGPGTVNGQMEDDIWAYIDNGDGTSNSVRISEAVTEIGNLISGENLK